MNNSKFVELILNRFFWIRNNTVELFEIAEKANVLDYKPKYLIENPSENHNLLYQFQCILTSTNGHFRRLRDDENKQFGIYVNNQSITKKQDIKKEDIAKLLSEQIEQAKRMAESNSSDLEKYLQAFFTICEHESLHHGQLVIMFREVNVDFPETFKSAWNL